MRKAVNHNLFYSYILIIGLFAFVAILIFGDAGGALLSLIAAMAFVKTKKPDERELQLLYRIGTYTLLCLYVSMILVYYLLPSINWLLIMACSFFFFHGISGLILFSTK